MLSTDAPTLVLPAEFPMTIGGRSVTSQDTAPVYNPATAEVIAEVPVATSAQLDEAVAAAHAAFAGWSATPLAERQAIVSAIGDRLEAHAEEFLALLTAEQGKPRPMAEWEVYGSVAWFREIAKQSLPEEVLEDTAERKVISRHTPLGVVGAIVPWNFPILLAVWKIAPALVAGNTIIVKPSPFTPLCDLKLVELVQDLLPAGVFSAVSGDNELGKWMTAHPGIAKISFTGSTDTGKRVMRAAAGTLKRVTLELGGNDPAIVLPDVDPAKIAPQIFWAAFQNNAQFCNAAKRVYIHDDVYDAVRDALVEYARTVVVGNGADAETQLGPIQNLAQFEKVRDYFDDCAANGYTFALGGQIDPTTRGWFVPVTLVDNPPEDSRLVVEEPFGPILPLLRWTEETDVVARANATVWGLGATVWGEDLGAIERIGRQLEAGTVWLNEVHQYSPHQVFGGHKQSGIGAENSLHGLAEYTNHQTIKREHLSNRKCNYEDHSSRPALGAGAVVARGTRHRRRLTSPRGPGAHRRVRYLPHRPRDDRDRRDRRDPDRARSRGVRNRHRGRARRRQRRARRPRGALVQLLRGLRQLARSLPMHCRDFIPLNLVGARLDGSSILSSDGERVRGHFFGQSSWATYAVANEQNCVRVARDLPLELLAPLGCGIQTGAGAVLNTLTPEAGSSIAIFGTRSVGLAALLGAVVAGCGTIIAVDIQTARLATATELGATHTINSAEEDVVERIREITGGAGAQYSVDCIGLADVVRSALECLQSPGVCATVGFQGIPNEISVDQGHLLFGRSLIGVIEGDAIPQEFVPRMIDLYRAGEFPFPKLIDTFEFDKINEAIDAVHRGKVTKAVLTFDEPASANGATRD